MFDFIKSNFLIEETSQIRSAHRTAFDLLIIVVVTTLVFVIILQNGFVIDDTSFILRWEEIRNLNNIPNLLKGAVPTGHEGIFRPVRGVFYAFSYQLWQTNPFGYHLQSILIHLITTVLVYLIARLMSGKKSIAFLSSILFGLHPLHTESVTYITASFDNIGALLFFIAFYCYLKSRGSVRSLRWTIASLVFGILAYLTYEITLILPILIFVYDLIFKKIKKNNLLNKLSVYFIYTIPVLLYAFIRVFVLNITYRGGYLAGSFYLTMLTMSKVFLKWLTLFVWPFQLSINPEIPGGIESWINSYSDLSVIKGQSILNLDIILSILVIIALVLIAILTIKKYQIISFSIFWIFISLLPVSYILPQGFLMAERNGYIASFGFVLLAAYLFNLIYEKKVKLQNLMISILIIIIAASFALTFIRNRDWFDELSIWQSLTHQKTGSTKANLYVGNFLTNKGDYKNAITAYQEVIRRQPDNIDAVYSLSLAYAANKQYSLAKSQYQKALTAKPDYSTPVRKIIDNLLNGGTAKPPEELTFDDTWLNYNTKQEFSLHYPKDWHITDIPKGVALQDKNKSLTIEIEVNPKDDATSYEEYINQQKNLPGTLTNEGSGNVPNTNLAFVRSWSDNNINILQFFLFKAGQVYEVKVKPSQSTSTNQVNQIIGSIKQ